MTIVAVSSVDAVTAISATIAWSSPGVHAIVRVASSYVAPGGSPATANVTSSSPVAHAIGVVRTDSPSRSQYGPPPVGSHAGSSPQPGPAAAHAATNQTCASRTVRVYSKLVAGEQR